MFPGVAGVVQNHIQLRTTDGVSGISKWHPDSRTSLNTQVLLWCCCQGHHGGGPEAHVTDGAALCSAGKPPAPWPHTDLGAQCCEFVGVPGKSQVGESWAELPEANPKAAPFPPLPPLRPVLGVLGLAFLWLQNFGQPWSHASEFSTEDWAGMCQAHAEGDTMWDPMGLGCLPGEPLDRPREVLNQNMLRASCSSSQTSSESQDPAHPGSPGGSQVFSNTGWQSLLSRPPQSLPCSSVWNESACNAGDPG